MSAPTFGESLRAWRLGTSPEEVGFDSGPTPRRTPGLRREELAEAAGISADYLQRLERDRARPSRRLVLTLVRVLRLSPGDGSHLLALADHHGAPRGSVPRVLDLPVQRLLERSAMHPVVVYDASWTWLTGSPAWATLFGHAVPGGPRPHNLAQLVFAGELGGLEHEQDEWSRRYLVSELRRAAARYPEDNVLAALLEDLLRQDDFAALWRVPEVLPHRGQRKVITATPVGDIRLDCDVLTMHDTDLRIVVFTAAADGPDRAKLSRLLFPSPHRTPTSEVPV